MDRLKRFFRIGQIEQGRGFLSRFRASDEGGMTIIELMIALSIFSVVAAGVAVGMGSALGLTRNNRNRSIAANLASREMDVVRSTPFNSLPLSGQTSTTVVDGVTYTIDRSTSWASRDGTTGVCDPPVGTSLAFLKVVVLVTWPNMAGVEPVRSETILAPPVGSYNADLGHLSVHVRDRDGAPANNHVVTVIGPGGTYTQTTQDGCAFFVGLTPGSFVVSLNSAGFVDGQGVQLTEQSTSIQAGAISSVEFDYDRSATISVLLQALTGYGVPSGVGMRLANTALEVGSKGFNTESGQACTTPTSTVYSSADAAVTLEFPNANYGTSSTFGVRSKIDKLQYSLVTFPLPSIPNNCQLASAKLRLWVNDEDSGRTLQAYQVSSAWSESTVTWNTKPSTTGTPSTVNSPSTKTWISFETTNIVKAMMSGSNYGFLLKDAGTDGDKKNKMDSRELTHDPELVFEWASGGPICNSVTLAPTDDTRVQQDGSSANQQKGGESTMKVRSDEVAKNQRVYIKFPVPAPPAGCQMTAATMTLYAESEQGPRTIDAYRAAAAWTESTVWWNNQPGPTGSPTSSVIIDKGFQTWNVLSLLQAGTNYGFMLRDSVEEGDPSREQKYRTKENGTEAHHPRLTIDYGEFYTLPGSITLVASGLYPYLNGYQIWPGLCADADPQGVDIGTGLAYHSGGQRDAATASNPNATTSTSTNLKSITVTVMRAGLPEVGVVVKAVHAADASCVNGQTITAGSTDINGELKTSLPLGIWELQVTNRTPAGSWPSVDLHPPTSNAASQTVTVN